MRLLTVNNGSSSIKTRLFDAASGTPVPVAGDVLDGLGAASGRRTTTRRRVAGDAASADVLRRDLHVADHREGLALLLDDFAAAGGVDVVAHRVVHGGTRFDRAVVVDDAVVQAIRELEPLAPLHNPFGLLGIEAARRAFPRAVQVAVFDTAWHRTLPPAASTYALPRELSERLGLRRYGFHGLSHRFVARQAARLLGRDEAAVNLVTLHLGAGASATAVRGGRSVDTTMGLTPLEGLVMATRSGDIDPAVPFFLMRHAGLDAREAEALLNERSGLVGLCGTKDMREVEERMAGGDADAAAAFDVFCHRVRKAIGAFFAVLGRVDAIVFTGGIGENSVAVRQRCCEDLGLLGVEFDASRNRAASGDARAIHRDDSRVAVLVVPTDEELEMATQAIHLLTAGEAPSPGALPEPDLSPGNATGRKAP